MLTATSIGFIPTESEPITKSGSRTGGTRYLRSELVEISLVSTPANPNAVALARSLRISDTTMKEVFKPVDLSIGQRIRKARGAVSKAKALQAKADTPTKRNTFSRIIALFEKAERELLAELRRAPKQATAHRLNYVRARAQSLLKKVDQRIEKEAARAADPWGVREREAEMLVNFAKHRQHDPVKTYTENEWRGEYVRITWRGQKLPSPTWRGKKI